VLFRARRPPHEPGPLPRVFQGSERKKTEEDFFSPHHLIANLVVALRRDSTGRFPILRPRGCTPFGFRIWLTSILNFWSSAIT